MTARFVAMVVMLAVVAARVEAQEVANDLSQVRGRVKNGDTLTITDARGQRVQGKLMRVDATGIDLWLDEQQRHFDGSMIETVESRDSLKNGAMSGLIIGGIVGVLGGLAISSIQANAGYDDAASQGLVAGVAYTVVGVAIGAGIDALVKGRRVIYARSKTTVSVAPVFNRQQKGVLFTLQH